MFESRHTISSPGETPEGEDQGGVLGNLCEAGSVKESESSGTQGQSDGREQGVFEVVYGKSVSGRWV